MWVQGLGWEDPLEGGMATHSSILTWRIPWAEEPGGLQSMGSQSQTRLKRLSSSSSGFTHRITFHIHNNPLCKHACVSKSLQCPKCSTLCNPMDCSPPSSSVHGIFQARILEWFAMPPSRGSSQPRDGIHISYISRIDRQVLYQ